MTMDPYEQNDPALQKKHLPPSTGPRRKTEAEAIHELQTKMGDPYVENDPNLQPSDGKTHYRDEDVAAASVQNFIPSAANFAGNIANVVTHPIQAGQGIVDAVRGAGANVADVIVPGSKEAWLAQSPDHQKMVDAANAIGQSYKDRYWGWDNFKRTFAEDPVGLLADLSMVVPGGQAVNPARVLNPVGRALGRAGRAVADHTSPTANLLLRATEGQEQPIINALRSPNREIVPGSVPTAGQAVANDVTATQFQALDKAAQRRLPTPAMNIKDTQNAARLEQLRTVGQTPADLEAAIQARNDAAAQNYAAAGVQLNPNMPTAHPVANILIPSDQAFLDLMERPEMNRVLARAREIAAEQGRPFQIGQNAPAQAVPSSVLGPNGQPLMTQVPATVAEYPAQSLHIMKQAFDDVIKNPEQFGIGATHVNAIRGTRNNFIRWIEDRNPAYGHARQEYAAASRPINQMQIGQYLEGKLMNPTLGEDTAALRADSFSNALDNVLNEAMGNGIISKATGEKRGRHIRDFLEPDQIAAVEAVQSDMARAKRAEIEAQAASQYGHEIDRASEAPQAPGFLNPLITVWNHLARAATGHVNNRISNRVANAMLTPDGAAAIIEEAIARRQAIENLSTPIRVGGRVVATINRAPGVYNALQYERDGREKKNALTK